MSYGKALYLRKENTILIHNRNLKFIVIEFYKVLNDLYLVLMREVSPLKDASVYNTRTRRPSSQGELDRFSLVLTR